MKDEGEEKQKFFKWTVVFEVAKEMLWSRLGYAYGHELRAKVTKAPDPAEIRKAQGYEV